MMRAVYLICLSLPSHFKQVANAAYFQLHCNFSGIDLKNPYPQKKKIEISKFAEPKYILMNLIINLT